MAKGTKQQAERRGRRAEWFAAMFLRLKGYQILSTRTRSKVGEIDLIARRGRSLIFVEVKYRHSRERAVEAISYHQRRRIERAAHAWLAREDTRQDTRRNTGQDKGRFSPRFDVIAVVPWQIPYHIENAWLAGD